MDTNQETSKELLATIPNRPEEADENIIKAAVAELLPDVMDYLSQSEDASNKDEEARVAEDVYDAVKGVSYKNFDAFHIARELEDRHYWDCDEEAVSVFSKISGIIYRICRDAQKKWVSDNNIVPKFKIGSKVNYRKYNSKYFNKDTGIGFITGFYQEQGEYVINEVYKTTYGGKVVRFENVIGLIPLSDEERNNLPESVLQANVTDATPAQAQVQSHL